MINPRTLNCAVRTRFDRGFTLIEAMLTILLIGIMLGIAVPSYNAYVIRANRSDALQGLLTAAACQERTFARTNAYDGDACASNSESGGYTFSISTSNNARNFEVSANPQGSQLKDACGVLSIDQAGIKRAGGEGGSFAARCWKGK